MSEIMKNTFVDVYVINYHIIFGEIFKSITMCVFIISHSLSYRL